MERNKKLIEEEIARGIVEVRSLPYDIQFSPEHRCNLRCVMCWYTAARKQGIVPMADRKLPDNTLERFKKLQPYMPYWESVSLTGSGEPLLSPAFPDILKVLSRYHASIVFTTNGMLIDRKKAEMLVKAGVDEVIISVDGACKETFERIRVNAKWEKFLKAIEILTTVKSELRSDSPHICFSANLMRQNIEELPDLIDFTVSHGGHKVLATNTIIYDPDMEQEALVHYPELTRKMVIEAYRRAYRYGIELDNRVLEPPEGVEVLEAEALALEEQEQPLLSNEGLAGAKSKVISVAAPPSSPKSGFIKGVTAAVSKSVAAVEGLYQGTFKSGDSTRVESMTDSQNREEVEIDDHPSAPTLAPTEYEMERPLAVEIDTHDPSTEDAISQAVASKASKGELPAILKACQMPWMGLMVESDGNVKVCCYTSPYVGNLDEQSFEEIWNSEPLKELRRSFVEDRPPEGCRNCFIFTKTLNEDSFLQILTTRHANVDSPGDTATVQGITTVHGWALDIAGVARIEILINGSRVGDATCGQERPDVAEAYPNYKDNIHSGFLFELDTTQLADSYHLLALRITNQDGETYETCHRALKVMNTAIPCP
jgi:radical SAM protein with 4Fe4S-binding SPASM domain